MSTKSASIIFHPFCRTSKKLNFIDKEHIAEGIENDAYGNEIATLDGIEYYAIDLSRFDTDNYTAEFSDDTHTLSDVVYTLQAFGSDGNLMGAMSI